MFYETRVTGNRIKGVVTDDKGREHDVIQISFNDGKWMMDMSSCLPTNIDMAAFYVLCMTEVLEKRKSK